MDIQEFSRLIKSVLDLPYTIEQDSRSSYFASADNGEMQVGWGYDISVEPRYSFECIKVVNDRKIFQHGKGNSPKEAFANKQEFERG